VTAGGTLRAGAPLERATAAAVVVHGRTLDPEYMMDNLVGELGVDEVAYLLPRHPDKTWYPGRFSEPAAALEPWLTDALDALDAEVAAAHAAGLHEERIALVGFSQGACLVAELLARRTRRFGAAAVLTGSLVGPPGDVCRPGPLIAGVPMFFSVSRYDEWVPSGRVEATAEVFRAAGAAVRCALHDDREHHINEADRAAVRELLTGVCATPAGPGP
jgi:phospholipase/carboxylesterase